MCSRHCVAFSLMAPLWLSCAGQAASTECTAQSTGVGGTPLTLTTFSAGPCTLEPPAAGVVVLSSEEAFQAAFSCPPADGGSPLPDGGPPRVSSGLNFSEDHLLLVTGENLRVAFVVDADGGVVVGLTAPGGCGGAPPQTTTEVLKVPARARPERRVGCASAPCRCGGFGQGPCPP